MLTSKHCNFKGQKFIWQIVTVWKFFFQVIQHKLNIPDKVILGWGGRLLNTPVIRKLTCRCSPTGLPSIFLWETKIADLCVYIVLYSYPDSNKKARMSKIHITLLWTGSTFCLTNQLAHLFQVNEFERVPSLLDETIKSAALSDILSSAKSYLRQLTPLIALFDLDKRMLLVLRTL